MKTERELFELSKKNAIQNILSVSGRSKTTKVISEEFDKLFGVISAQREGYKLVPVELSKEAIGNLDDKFIEVILKDDEDYQDLYKAMIGASDA